jgi:RHS repeat-associated protein
VPLASGGCSPDDRGFIGERHDTDTGLIDLNARWYDPVLARFTAADDWDPIDAEDAVRGASIGWLANTIGTNRYAYSGNDPLNKSDPNGHEFGTSYQRGYDSQPGIYDYTPSGSYSPGYGLVTPGAYLSYSGNSTGGSAGNGSLWGSSSGNNQSDYAYYSNGTLHAQTGKTAGGGQGSGQPLYSFQSYPILRSLVPGQIAWDDALTNFGNGNYSAAGTDLLAMFGDQAAFAATLGVQEWSVPAKEAVTQSLKNTLGPYGPIFGRTRLGGSSIGQINSHDAFRIGWGWKGTFSNGEHVFRISGDWITALGIKSGHIDLLTLPGNYFP